jgi:Dihydrodipicolinate synthase/N-acetylneuraminate lyase
MSDKKFVPVMITPFNLKAKVDLDVVSLLVDFYLAAGVKGFLPIVSAAKCSALRKMKDWN